MRLPAAILALAVALGGCTTLPKPRSIACEAALSPVVTLSEDGLTASTRIEVLTYNVEGLPWPARSGRKRFLHEIGERLAMLRARGEAPHVVMFQEVFSRSAARTVTRSGYPSLAPGPSHSQRPPPALRRHLPGKPNPHRGELGIKLLSSGVVIASEFPIVEQRSQPFARGSCAGFDCLANKGVVLARIAIPGVPGSLRLFNTHMNAQGASRVPEPRHSAAHAKQAREISEFMAMSGYETDPVVLGGDFNMKASETRFSRFSHFGPPELVHSYCIAHPEICDVRMSWDGDAPWMDTQDLQLFSSGAYVTVRPVRVETMFDGGPSGPLLSDHDGFRVTYELSWPVAAAAPACAAS